MFKLRVDVKQCVSCGICMDVCMPRAISMRTSVSRTVEGKLLTHLHASLDRTMEAVVESAMTFPYLAIPDQCDGCSDCVQGCPTLALQLEIHNTSLPTIAEMAVAAGMRNLND